MIKQQKNQREPHEQLLRNIVARIVRQNRQIRDIARKHSNFYKGHGAEPPRAERLSLQTNPKRNGAEANLNELAAALKFFPRGMYPVNVLNRLFDSTISLIEDDLESVCPAEALNIAVTVVSDFYLYLTTPFTLTPTLEHERAIDEHIARWKRRFCKNSDAFYTHQRQLIERLQGGARPASQSPARHYRARAAITLDRAHELTGLSKRTIQNLEKDPKGSRYPGRNLPEAAFIAWAVGYSAEKVRKHWANMMNHPIPVSALPPYLQEKLSL